MTTSRELTEKEKQQQLERIRSTIVSKMKTDNWQLIQELKGGLSGASTNLITIDGVEYIAKLNEATVSLEDMTRIYAAIKTASQLGIAPHVFCADLEQRVIIMEYIKVKQQSLREPKYITTFARVIRKMHDECGEYNKYISIFKKAHDNFNSEKLPQAVKDCHVVADCKNALSAIEEFLHDEGDIRPSHVDLNPGNVIFDGETIKLLDWDSASPQNLYFDLATCALFYYYYDEDNLCRELLTQYLQRTPDEVEENKYYMMRIFAYMYFGIGFVTIYPNLKPLSDKDCQTLPSFSEMYRIIASGQVTPENLQKFGLSCLNKAFNEINDNKYLSLIRKPGIKL